MPQIFNRISSRHSCRDFRKIVSRSSCTHPVFDAQIVLFLFGTETDQSVRTTVDGDGRPRAGGRFRPQYIGRGYSQIFLTVNLV